MDSLFPFTPNPCQPAAPQSWLPGWSLLVYQSLCPLSAGKTHSETDSPWSAQTQENLHGLGRMTWEEAFQNTCCSSQSLLSSSVISLPVLCRALAQFLPTPASSKVSLGCPCSVPVSLLGVTELQALDRPWCTTSMEEMWLGISATIAPLCLGEPPTVVGAGEAAWPGHMGTAQRQPGCPFSPERQLVSPGPLPMAVPTARASYSCWIGPDNLELKGFQGLSQDSSMASQEASLQDPRGV